MSEDGALVATFPAPPAFMSLYAEGPEMGPPPPPPLKPTYHSFGTPYATEDAVADLLPEGKVYESGCNVKNEMKRINKSLMLSFLELIEVLLVNPAKFSEKIEDIEKLFVNMHNLINAYRPHQARETLIDLLKQQIEERKQATAEIRQVIENNKIAVQAAHAELEADTKLHDMEDIPEASVEEMQDVPEQNDPMQSPPPVDTEKLLQNQLEQQRFFDMCQQLIDNLKI
ncbi:mediator of RNA polymerase II transcription subunit [Thraustotheca clavata]|uniref:Mediator of RNA polymerase II transcription subunit 7 n=1 Tax=Thraustotheca clavata TaxID=74557 RepID=A0A1W0AAM3_9STRA|nr:mediator of RNA polymerase II transcription subunit [Thraustotheca clavata]